MDPITAIGLLASIANLIEAGRAVSKLIHTFKHAEDDMRNLAADIFIFTEALGGFERVMRSKHVVHRIAPQVITNVTENSLRTFKELEKHLEQTSSSDFSAIRRTKWMRDHARIKKLHNRIREQNIVLQSFLQITHAYAIVYHVLT